MSSKTRVLTGITTTGSPHLGNYVGAIRPAIAASRDPSVESFYFLADYHALVKCQEPERVQRSTLEIAATWLACGLDPERVFFYRQSDLPEVAELTWFLTCICAKGLLNRAHAYKAAVDANTAAGEDPDAGISAGLYMYPVLMAADILLFNAHRVPVGRDQIQHIEIARDLAQRFNHVYGGELFTQPEAAIDEQTAILPGLDGRKMSKSYDNTIPLWLPREALRKALLGIVTNSQAPGEAKDPDASHIFTIYRAFAREDESERMRVAFASGISWGDAKQQLFERIDAELGEARERYFQLKEQPQLIEEVLRAGADRARSRARELLNRLRDAVGLRNVANAPASQPESEAALFDKLIGASNQAEAERIADAAIRPVEFTNPFNNMSEYSFRVYTDQTFVLCEAPDARSAGLLLKELKSADAARVDVRPEPSGLGDVPLFRVTLFFDNRPVGRGEGNANEGIAIQNAKNLHQSLLAFFQARDGALKKREAER